MTDEEIQQEYQKCRDSPYYFAITYLTVNGKPFKTELSEEKFNERYRQVNNYVQRSKTRNTYGNT